MGLLIFKIKVNVDKPHKLVLFWAYDTILWKYYFMDNVFLVKITSYSPFKPKYTLLYSNSFIFFQTFFCPQHCPSYLSAIPFLFLLISNPPLIPTKLY